MRKTIKFLLLGLMLLLDLALIIPLVIHYPPLEGVSSVYELADYDSHFIQLDIPPKIFERSVKSR